MTVHGHVLRECHYACLHKAMKAVLGRGIADRYFQKFQMMNWTPPPPPPPPFRTWFVWKKNIDNRWWSQNRFGRFPGRIPLSTCRKTCQRRPPLGANKSRLCRQVVFICRFHTLMQCETHNGRYDWKQTNKQTQRSCAAYKTSQWEELKCVSSAWALLGLPQILTFGQGTLWKRTVADRHTVAQRRENRPTAYNSLAAGRARQVVAIRSAVSVWNCPCKEKRLLEAGGHYSRWSLKPGGFTVFHLGYVPPHCHFQSSIPTWVVTCGKVLNF